MRADLGIDRGIIHRDLKPENVMPDHFGDEYVLDWGIAVSLRDDENPPCTSATTTSAATRPKP